MEMDKAFAEEVRKYYHLLRMAVVKEADKRRDSVFPVAVGQYGISRGRKLVIRESDEVLDLRDTLTFVSVMFCFGDCRHTYDLPEEWWLDNHKQILVRSLLRDTRQAVKLLKLNANTTAISSAVKEWVIRD